MITLGILIFGICMDLMFCLTFLFALKVLADIVKLTTGNIIIKAISYIIIYPLMLIIVAISIGVLVFLL